MKGSYFSHIFSTLSFCHWTILAHSRPCQLCNSCPWMHRKEAKIEQQINTWVEGEVRWEANHH